MPGGCKVFEDDADETLDRSLLSRAMQGASNLAV